MYCSCGCGKYLPPGQERVNEWGELETMREDCRAIGRGESPDIEEELNKLRQELYLLDMAQSKGYTVVDEEEV
jgi:hypothetical protein